MDTLLIEIGTEEIPAGYIEPALNALSSTLLKKLTHARIDHGNACVFGTPKRLAVEVANVSDKQPSVTEEVTGPPERVAFDENGKPAVAAQKFAEKIGVSLDELKIRETEKGRYLCAEKTEKGRLTEEILAEILPDVIRATPFPKTMKWADMNFYFARPVHTILAMLGEKVIPFAIENIQSGNTIAGHHFMQPETITINNPGEYADKLRSAYVMADLGERRKAVEEEIARVADELGGKILPDEELTDIVKNLVEYPFAVAGRFDTEYLEVPDEILITAMREHQKYFAVCDEEGKLMPCFIAVNNTRAKDMALVGKGHERVIRARLADARFFYKADMKSSFDDWAEKLKRVLFQAKLGSVYEKVMRVREISEFLADAAEQSPEVREQTSRAAYLCKTDLVSEVVGEFPKLQGIMGKTYASEKGEHSAVAWAIEEHYRPTYSGGPLPESMTGALLAIADKIDSICGCFSVGLVPTGASDPYALRRQGIGILQIMQDKGFSFSLREMIRKSAGLFREKADQDAEETVNAVYTFLQNRMSHLLAEEGFSKDVIAAVVSVSVDCIPDVRSRISALETLKAEPDFEPLSVAFKRVGNILRKADAGVSGEIDESLFDHECESALFAACKSVKGKVAHDLDKGQFDQALLDIASLRGAVDAFFDGVMVMAEDQTVRDNRLLLLRQIADMFGEFADFSKIST
ncbi:MAG: glycine--tRNA ligase subunit beta [Desulfobacteraceae bacterium 4572_88]|nr:MAG: glycine--tRNA ligase subunit beta [Desulfobacteraceae bacterium 4572_88]